MSPGRSSGRTTSCHWQGPWGYESKTVTRGREEGEGARFPQPGLFSPLEIPGQPPNTPPPHTHTGTENPSVGGGTTGVLGTEGRKRAGGFWKKELEKWLRRTKMRRRSQSKTTAGQLVPWQRSCGREVGRLVRKSVVTWSPNPTWTSQLLSPFLPSTLHFPCLGSWSFAQVQGPFR